MVLLNEGYILQIYFFLIFYVYIKPSKGGTCR